MRVKMMKVSDVDIKSTETLKCMCWCHTNDKTEMDNDHDRHCSKCLESILKNIELALPICSSDESSIQ